MLVLTHQDLRSALDGSETDVIDAVRQAYILHAQGATALPPGNRTGPPTLLLADGPDLSETTARGAALLGISVPDAEAVARATRLTGATRLASGPQVSDGAPVARAAQAGGGSEVITGLAGVVKARSNGVLVRRYVVQAQDGRVVGIVQDVTAGGHGQWHSYSESQRNQGQPSQGQRNQGQPSQGQQGQHGHGRQGHGRQGHGRDYDCPGAIDRHTARTLRAHVVGTLHMAGLTRGPVEVTALVDGDHVAVAYIVAGRIDACVASVIELATGHDPVLGAIWAAVADPALPPCTWGDGRFRTVRSSSRPTRRNKPGTRQRKRRARQTRRPGRGDCAATLAQPQRAWCSPSRRGYQTPPPWPTWPARSPCSRPRCTTFWAALNDDPTTIDATTIGARTARTTSARTTSAHATSTHATSVHATTGDPMAIATATSDTARAFATWHALLRLWHSWGIAPTTVVESDADPAAATTVVVDSVVSIDLGACLTPHGLATALAELRGVTTATPLDDKAAHPSRA